MTVWAWAAVVVAVLTALTVALRPASTLRTSLLELHERQRQRHAEDGDGSGTAWRKLMLFSTAFLVSLGGLSTTQGNPTAMAYDQAEEDAGDLAGLILEEEGEDELAAAWQEITAWKPLAEAVREGVQALIAAERKRRLRRIATARRQWGPEELAERLLQLEEEELLDGLGRVAAVEARAQELLELALERTRPARERALSRAIARWEPRS